MLFTDIRGQIKWFVGLLISYWAALELIPVPGFGAGQLTAEASLVGYVDRLLIPGRLFLGVHEPEGLLSTVPAAATALAGALCGHLLRTGPQTKSQKATLLAGAGVAALGVGWVWALVLPLNKNLWTSSFVVYTAGWSLLLLALFYYLIDVRRWHRWAFFFTVIGVNSILIYTAGRVIDFGYATGFFLDGLLQDVDEAAATFIWWLGFIAVEWLFLWWLHRREIFLRI